ncbi:hypothetical protein VCRA2113O213_350041 [Vibrio crassostreae]|nr:hypothetical protein VCRA2113O213_350041 [Vibrio crassostreae]
MQLDFLDTDLVKKYTGVIPPNPLNDNQANEYSCIMIHTKKP